MQYQMYESKPLPFSLPKELYTGGANDQLHIEELVKGPISLKLAMSVVSNPQMKLQLTNGESISCFPTRKVQIPVNRANVEKYGIVSANHMDRVLDTIELTLSPGKQMLTKPEMMVLNMLANYEWDRPIHFTSIGADLKLDLDKYLQFDGFVYTLVPILSTTLADNSAQINADLMYERIMNVYRWDSFSDLRIHVDYQNLFTFHTTCCIRNIFSQTARALMEEGKMEQAIEVLDKMQEVMKPELFPLNTTLIGGGLLNSYSVKEAIEIYFAAGATEKAETLSDAFAEELFLSLHFFGRLDVFSNNEIQSSVYYLLFPLIDVVEQYNKEKAEVYEKRLQEWAKTLKE
jgi:hypothetical protein